MLDSTDGKEKTHLKNQAGFEFICLDTLLSPTLDAKDDDDVMY
jgi:hypothetical protein